MHYTFFTSAICYSGDPVPADTSDVPDTTETIPTVLTTQESEPPQEQPFSDLDLIRAEGHPTYYGSTKVAHEIWDSAPKGKVIFADSFAKRSDNTIIYMWGYRQGENSEIIRDLQLVFYNSDDLRSIELDEALQIADEYLPHDIMNQWYEFSRSYALVPHDSKKGTCYVVTYHLTDSGKNSNEHPYSGTIDVILDVSTETNQVYSSPSDSELQNG